MAAKNPVLTMMLIVINMVFATYFQMMTLKMNSSREKSINLATYSQVLKTFNHFKCYFTVFRLIPLMGLMAAKCRRLLPDDDDLVARRRRIGGSGNFIVDVFVFAGND